MKKQQIRNFIVIVIGNITLALGISLFILNHGIVNGGTSGVALIIERLFNFNPVLAITILTWALFAVGFFILGKEFALKTLISTILYPFFTSIFTNVNYFMQLANQVSNPLLATLAGAVCIGFGLGITYRVGASTGGFDIVSLILQKYWKIKLSVSTFVIDTLIIAVGLISISLESALYGIICVCLTSFVIEKITISGTNCYMAHIVSDKYEEINDYLINVLERGTTLIKSEGGLSRKERLMIEVVFNEKEYYEIKRNVHQIDKDAFISVYKAINTYGNGFTEMFVRRK